MIRKLRRRHLNLWVFLAISLPILFVAALAARRDAPRVESIDPRIEPASDLTSEAATRWVQWTGAKLETRLLARGDDASLISLAPRDGGLAADLVVYWTKALPAIGRELPQASVLLGSLGNGTSLLVPQVKSGAGAAGGFLSLYSVSQRVVVAHADLSPIGVERAEVEKP